MKLIDKEQAYKTLSKYYHHTGMIQHQALREALDRVPVVDAEPVIRCKDCIYSVDEYDDGECYCEYEVLTYIKDWNHYCGHAKRNRQEKQNG